MSLITKDGLSVLCGEIVFLFGEFDLIGAVDFPFLGRRYLHVITKISF